nr:lytic transglycosylase domain-containing protein [Micromonospora mirobrigensis]
MADGEQRSTVRPLRPATPPDGPLAGSGAAPDPTSLPRPRRPWSKPPADDEKATAAEPAEATAADQKADDDEKAADDVDPAGEVAKVVAVPRRRRVPFAHAVRSRPPGRLMGASRATRDWSRRPAGRLALSGLFLLGLVAATAAAGAIVIPATAGDPRPVAVDATSAAPGSGVPQEGVPPGVPAPSGAAASPAWPAPNGPGLPGVTPLPDATALPGATVFPGATAPPGGAALPGVTGQPGATPTVGAQPGRPADALADWARLTGARVGISPVAMQAYGYAELVLAQTHRSCQLSWTTLAAIGYVESRHGQANGATLQPNGRAEPEIIGDPLDGQGGRSLIRDTDRGVIDGDPVHDRALGPMQFIPTTWQQVGADADNDGKVDPHDLDDAALAAGRYLCQGGRNMTIAGDWWGAILSYNDVRRYAQDVYDKANEYGLASRT